MLEENEDLSAPSIDECWNCGARDQIPNDGECPQCYHIIVELSEEHSEDD